jgi:hypothetical protein
MTGARKIIAVLIAVLWALGPMHLHNPSADKSGLSTVSHYNTKHEAESRSNQCICHAAKAWIRRFALAFPREGQIGGAPAPGEQAWRLENPSGAFGSSEFCALLAGSWQFEWRTALSPRAPSLVA